ncbi:Os04g0209450, partial [Oryza sativa Japonica Group]
DSITVHDSRYAVRNADDSAISELFSDDPLDSRICLRINGSCCLIHEQDPAALQNNTTKAEELLLSYAPVLPHVGNYKEQHKSKYVQQ